MKNLQVFSFNQNEVRVVMIENDPWWIAKDVCAALNISKHRDAISRLDDDERGSVEVDTLGGNQAMAAVNENGLYSLILESRKPEAKPFKRWVTHEILPSIRKTGGYSTPQFEIPTTLPEALRLAADQVEQNEKLKIEIEANAPLVLFAESVSASKDSILIGELSKVLNQNGVDIGRNRLFAWLKENGYLMKSGEEKNQPTQYRGMGSLDQQCCLKKRDASIKWTSSYHLQYVTLSACSINLNSPIKHKQLNTERSTT